MTRSLFARWRPAATALAATLALAAPTVLVAPGAGAQPSDTVDPALEQRIEADQHIGSGTAVLREGHVDIGPVVDEGTWRLMIHDDTTEPSVWRDPDEVALHITDDALVEVPDDPAYQFLGAQPGAQVHVVSQTQQPGVAWVGWNTQHPEVMERIDRGVTLTMLGVEGPGQLSVYLQSGNFGDPDVLWSSANPERQSIWVDVNTHTHANWVFTEPGAYLVRVQVEAELRDGTTERAVADLRFAVGSATEPTAALRLEPSAGLLNGTDDPTGGAAAAPEGPEERSSGTAPFAVAVAALVVAGIAVGAAFTLRARRVRRRAGHLIGGDGR